MGQHKFAVGQMVDYRPPRSSIPPSLKGYEIKRRLPSEGGDFLYRIKSSGELFERIAKEQELVRRMPA